MLLFGFLLVDYGFIYDLLIKMVKYRPDSQRSLGKSLLVEFYNPEKELFERFRQLTHFPTIDWSYFDYLMIISISSHFQQISIRQSTIKHWSLRW